MSKTKRYLLAAAGLVFFLLFWEGVSSFLLPVEETFLLPPPSSIPAAFISEVSEGIWHVMLVSSFRHYAAGFLVGSVLGVTLGVTVALSPRVEASQAWLARIFRPIPPLAWIPFAITWFGLTETAAAFIISVGIFWTNYFTAMTAVQSVDKDLIEVARAFGHRTFASLLRKVILPGAAPGILGGLRVGLGQGWMTVVAAELFGIPGIGQRMNEASGLLQSEVVILYMFSIALLYGVSDYIFVIFQNKILAWQR
ncbi:MAG: ABC transporter permease [Rhodospirillales bacterium]|nr:ABC transporter permease [Rhodospirillales bacterium]